MKVSIWWPIATFYLGLFGGIFITIGCQTLKRISNSGHY